MMTPIKVGITVTVRLAIVVSMRSALELSEAGSFSSCLDDAPIVDLAVEPVAVTGDVRLGRDVQVRLQQRDARHVVIGLVEMKPFTSVAYLSLLPTAAAA